MKASESRIRIVVLQKEGLTVKRDIRRRWRPAQVYVTGSSGGKNLSKRMLADLYAVRLHICLCKYRIISSFSSLMFAPSADSEWSDSMWLSSLSLQTNHVIDPEASYFNEQRFFSQHSDKASPCLFMWKAAGILSTFVKSCRHLLSILV